MYLQDMLGRAGVHTIPRMKDRNQATTQSHMRTYQVHPNARWQNLLDLGPLAPAASLVSVSKVRRAGGDQGL